MAWNDQELIMKLHNVAKIMWTPVKAQLKHDLLNS